MNEKWKFEPDPITRGYIKIWMNLLLRLIDKKCAQRLYDYL